MARLVIVAGAPGSGKTRLARTLATNAGWQALEKDSIKEALADAVGAPRSLGESQRLGTGSYAALFALATSMLQDGVDIIVESNFKRGVSEADLSRVVRAATDTRLVHCSVPREVAIGRYQRRFASGERHGAHLDDARLPGLERDFAQDRYEPLELGCPVLIVDTQFGYEPPLPTVVSFAIGRGNARGT